MFVFTIAGALLLGSTGSALLIWLAWNQLNVVTTVVAVLSPTVLGALLGFSLSSFTQTAGGAWFEASNGYRQEKQRRAEEMAAAATRRFAVQHDTERSSTPVTALHAQSPDRA